MRIIIAYKLYEDNYSLYGGVSKNFYYLKDKKFLDWEITPWELFIFEDKLLGYESFSKVYLA